MSGEARMARGAVALGAAVLPVAAGVAYAARGREGAVSAAIAVLIVVANFAAAAAVSALAGRRSPLLAAFVGLPSYVVRMAAVLVLLVVLRGAAFIDAPSFALTFGVGVVAVLAVESLLWARTPWAALTLGEKR